MCSSRSRVARSWLTRPAFWPAEPITSAEVIRELARRVPKVHSGARDNEQGIEEPGLNDELASRLAGIDAATDAVI